MKPEEATFSFILEEALTNNLLALMLKELGYLQYHQIKVKNYNKKRKVRFTPSYSRKSDFQPSTTNPDNISHLSKPGKFGPYGGFEGGFIFLKILKKSN